MDITLSLKYTVTVLDVFIAHIIDIDIYINKFKKK